MKAKLLIGALLLVTGTAIVTSQAVSQEDPITPPSQEEMMKKWQEVMTPGKPHAWLKRLEGKWTTTNRFWMGGPGSREMKSAGTAEFRAILGGRFLEHRVGGEFLPGMPIEALGLMGYDNFQKRFVSVWMDSFGTSITMFHGHSNRDGKTIRFYGTMDEPTIGMVGKYAQFNWTLVDENTLVITAYDLGIGPDTKVMEIVHKRVHGKEKE